MVMSVHAVLLMLEGIDRRVLCGLSEMRVSRSDWWNWRVKLWSDSLVRLYKSTGSVIMIWHNNMID